MNRCSVLRSYPLLSLASHIIIILIPPSNIRIYYSPRHKHSALELFSEMADPSAQSDEEKRMAAAVIHAFLQAHGLEIIVQVSQPKS